MNGDYALHTDNTSNRCATYNRSATKTICDTVLTQLFFSAANMKIIQNAIRYQVWEGTNNGALISDQNADELLLVMRSIYFQFGKNLPTHITEQIEELNRYVVQDVCSSSCKCRQPTHCLSERNS